MGHFLHVENPNRISKSLNYVRKVVVNKLHDKVASNMKIEGKMEEEGQISSASKIDKNGKEKEYRLEFVTDLDEIK